MRNAFFEEKQADSVSAPYQVLLRLNTKERTLSVKKCHETCESGKRERILVQKIFLTKVYLLMAQNDSFLSVYSSVETCQNAILGRFSTIKCDHRNTSNNENEQSNILPVLGKIGSCLLLQDFFSEPFILPDKIPIKYQNTFRNSAKCLTNNSTELSLYSVSFLQHIQLN